MNITLRKAVIEDSKMVLEWRNEPTTIPWMSSAKALSFDEHDNWFRKAISDSNCLFLIIESNSKPVGVIRYNLDSSNNNYARASMNITQKMQGKGIGTIAHRKGIDLVKKMRFAPKIFARVLPDNIGAIKAAESVGFEKTGNIEIHGVKYLTIQYTVSAET